jgi:hypothetical protein
VLNIKIKCIRMDNQVINFNQLIKITCSTKTDTLNNLNIQTRQLTKHLLSIPFSKFLQVDSLSKICRFTIKVGTNLIKLPHRNKFWIILEAATIWFKIR